MWHINLIWRSSHWCLLHNCIDNKFTDENLRSINQLCYYRSGNLHRSLTISNHLCPKDFVQFAIQMREWVIEVTQKHLHNVLTPQSHYRIIYLLTEVRSISIRFSFSHETSFTCVVSGDYTFKVNFEEKMRLLHYNVLFA